MYLCIHQYREKQQNERKRNKTSNFRFHCEQYNYCNIQGNEKPKYSAKIRQVQRKKIQGSETCTSMHRNSCPNQVPTRKIIIYMFKL